MSEHPDGYLATPVRGNGGAVLVLHAWWGLNDTFRGLCDRLAEAGYLAFAPDLYHGRVANTIQGADALRLAALDNVEAVWHDVTGGLAYLDERAGRPAGGVAVMGFSMGGDFALSLARARPERVGKVVLFYGLGPDDLAGTRAAVLGHFAANDEYESRDYMLATEQMLRDAGCAVTFYEYPGTAHWFFEPDRPEYDAAAADLAWARTLEFLA